MANRLYLVVAKDGTERIIDAPSQGAALRVCTVGMFTVRPATARDVDRLRSAGVRVEAAETKTAGK